uniref:Dolichyl-diphosphooligosaccharide--protein glycosyltransferase subunit 1 n=1 Tax=Cacopsylla melanoneura TaxID=428564 RepID=A0A8D8VB15_9HEMI
MRFIDHIFDNMVIDEAFVKIILPENVYNIRVHVPYNVLRHSNTYLPNLVLHSVTIMPSKNIQNKNYKITIPRKQKYNTTSPNRSFFILSFHGKGIFMLDIRAHLVDPLPFPGPKYTWSRKRATSQDF